MNRVRLAKSIGYFLAITLTFLGLLGFFTLAGSDIPVEKHKLAMSVYVIGFMVAGFILKMISGKSEPDI